MVPSDFLTGICPQTYQRHTQMANFLLQRPNILKIIENIDAEKTECRTFAIPHHDHGTLFSSWTKEGSHLVRTAMEYVWSPMKLHLFHGLSFYEIERGLLGKLHGLFQKRDKSRSPSFSALLCTAPFANETIKATMKKIFSVSCTFMSNILAIK